MNQIVESTLTQQNISVCAMITLIIGMIGMTQTQSQHKCEQKLMNIIKP